MNLELGKVKKAAAVYTGGGIYIYYAEMESGFWVLGGDMDLTVVNRNPLIDRNEDGQLQSDYPDWQETHEVISYSFDDGIEYHELLLDIIQAIDDGRVIDGYNNCRGELDYEKDKTLEALEEMKADKTEVSNKTVVELLSWEDKDKLFHKLSTSYSKESDMTFITEEVYVNDERIADPLISEEVVGFLHGNVTDAKTIRNEYERHSLKAEFHDKYYVDIMLMLADIREGIGEMGNDREDILNSHFTLKWSLNGREIELGWSAPEVQALEKALQDILDEE